MTAVRNTSTGWGKVSLTQAIPPGDDRNLQANTTATAPAGGQAVFYDGSGNVALSDGTVPGLICAGVCDDKEAPVSSIAAANSIRLWQGFFELPLNGTSSDAILSTTVIAPVWDGGNGVPGLLSNLSGNNRSLMGLTFGLSDGGYPIIWAGPVAQTIARALHGANNESAGSVAYPVDGGATADVGSTSAATAAIIMPRSKVHGVITSIEIIPSAALSATSGNDRTITIWKLDTLGVAAAVNVGTFTTTTALVAQTRALFTLSVVAGALNMLETDILAYSTVHASSGAVIPQSAIRANLKVI